PDQLCLALVAALALFFSGLYGFNAKRLLVYLAWPAGLLLARGLLAVSRDGTARLRLSIATGLAVAAAALPLPGAGPDATWAAVWPLPPLYANARLTTAANGSPSLSLARDAVQLERAPVGQLAGMSTPGRVLAERARFAARPPAPRLDPATFAADSGALYLFDSEGENGGRYRTLTRLGNALRKRVKLVPRAELLPGLPLVELTPLGTLGRDYAVHRARLAVLPGTWLLVPAASRPRAAQLPSVSAADGERNAAAVAKARALARFAAGTTYVALVLAGDRADRSQLYLPFLVETTELYVVPENAAARTLSELARDPLTAEARFGDTIARRLVVLGKPATLVRYPPASGRRDPPLRR
ncbi:MAG TPA: hypothetical protein VGE98_08590, partial [Thermoanaerobaculia bacterium]